MRLSAEEMNRAFEMIERAQNVSVDPTQGMAVTTGTSGTHLGVQEQDILFYQTESTSFTITADQTRTCFDCTSALVVTLPDATTVPSGDQFDTFTVWVKADISSGTVTLATSGGQTIDGLSSLALTNYRCVGVQSTGTNWIIVTDTGGGASCPTYGSVGDYTGASVVSVSKANGLWPLTIGAPTSIIATNLLICFLAVSDLSNGNTYSLSGWTQQDVFGLPTPTTPPFYKIAVFVKEATSSEPSSYTFSSFPANPSGGCAIMLQVAGLNFTVGGGGVSLDSYSALSTNPLGTPQSSIAVGSFSSNLSYANDFMVSGIAFTNDATSVSQWPANSGNENWVNWGDAVSLAVATQQLTAVGRYLETATLSGLCNGYGYSYALKTAATSTASGCTLDLPLGVAANLSATGTLSEGEVAFSEDTNSLYIGTASGVPTVITGGSVADQGLSSSSVIQVDSTPIISGTDGDVLIQSSGLVGESALSTLLDDLGGISGTF